MSIKKTSIKKDNCKRHVEITLSLSEFGIPPMRDILVVGKRAPIGIEAVRRMSDALAPDRFIIIPVEDEIIEAILLRKKLLQLVRQEHLIPLIEEEARKIMQKEDVIKIDVNINVSVKKTIDL